MKFLKLFILMISTVQGLRTCTVIAPEFLHSARKFKLSLAVNNLEVSSRFEVSIESVNFKESNVVDVQPNGVQIVEFNLPNLPPDEYVLRIEGEKGSYLKTSALLKYSNYKPIFAIQLDKYLYRRDETLHYRILCMNEVLQPIVPSEAVDVRIINDKHQTLLNLKQINFTNHVSKGEIFLNSANFQDAGVTRLSVFSHGELLTAMNFEIIDNFDDYIVKSTRNHQHTKCNEIPKVYTKVIKKQHNETDSLFSVELKDTIKEKSYTQSQLIVFNITSSKPFKHLVYSVIGRGNVISSERIDFQHEAKEYLLKLKPTNEMVPLSKLIVYFVDENNRFHYDQAMFNVDAQLPNELLIHTAKNLKPNEKFELHIETVRGSYVGLLAVEDPADANNCHYLFNNDLKIEELLKHFGGQKNLQRGELTGTIILTTAENFAYKDLEFHRTWTAQQENNLKKEFPLWQKSWFFAEIENTTSDNLTLTHNLPNYDATWRITVFSLNAQKGLGYATLSPLLTTKKSYNVTIDVPKNIHAQEVFILLVRIENYLNSTIEITVEFVQENYEIGLLPIFQAIQKVNVEPRGRVELKYPLRISVAGKKLLKFLSFSNAGNERKTINLIVKPQGLLNSENLYVLMDLENHTMFNKLILPYDNAVMYERQCLNVDLYANLMEPFLLTFETDDFLENIVSAEQLISRMAIGKICMDYLKLSNKTNLILQTKIIRQMHLAYLTLLQLRRNENGGFNYFAWNEEREESVWLTSYFLTYASHMGSFFDIDATIIEKGLDFLSKSQNNDGSFQEKGLILNSVMGNDSLAITAQVLWAFVEQKNYHDLYKPVMGKSVQFIYENIPKSENLYARALAIFVIRKAGLDSLQREIERLESLATCTQDYKFWAEGSDNNFINVATTALILLTSIEKLNEIEQKFLPTIKWLIEKGNIYSAKGVYPTLSTVLGVEVLSKYALTKTEKTNADFTIVHQGLFKKHYDEFELNDGKINSQHKKLHAQEMSVELQANGRGLALAQIHYDYFMLRHDNEASFEIIIERPQRKNFISFILTMCVKYEGYKQTAELTIVEIGLISGYKPKSEHLMRLVESEKIVKHAAINNDDSTLLLYLLGLERNKRVCIPVGLYRVSFVEEHVKVPVNCYEYTDPAKKTVAFYNIESNLCSLCNGDSECLQNCFSKHFK